MRSAFIVATGLAFQPVGDNQDAGAGPAASASATCPDKDADHCLIDQLSREYEATSKPQLLLRIGVVYERIQLRPAALKTYLRYRAACEAAPSSGCTDVSELIARLEQRVGKLRITTTQAIPRSIDLDGVPVELNEARDGIWVEPGDHVVRVTWPNGQPSERSFTIGARGDVTIDVAPVLDDYRNPQPVYGMPSPSPAVRGCGCELAEDTAPRDAWTLAAIAAASMVLRRRRR